MYVFIEIVRWGKELIDKVEEFFVNGCIDNMISLFKKLKYFFLLYDLEIFMMGLFVLVDFCNVLL